MVFDFDVTAAFALCSGSVHFVGLLLGVGAYFMYNTIVASFRPVAPRLIGHRFKTVDSETSSLEIDVVEDAAESVGFDVGVSSNVADTGSDGRGATVVVSRQQYSDTMRETVFAKRMRDVPAVQRVCLLVGCVVITVAWVCSTYSNHRHNVCTSWRRGPNAIAVALWASMPPTQPSVTSFATKSAWTRQLHVKRSSAAVKKNITNTCKNLTATSMPAICVDEASSPAAVHVTEPLQMSSPIIELVHSSHSALMPLCKAIGGQLRALRKAAKPRELRAMGTLISLQRLEEPYRALLTALRLAHAFAESIQNMSHVECSTAGVGAHDGNHSLSCGRSEELKMELHELGSSMAVCMLDALQEGRLVAVMLSQDETLVKQAVSCEPSLMEGLEAIVVGEADDTDDAAVVFALGVYWSDVGVATSDAPFFGTRRDTLGDTSWQKDETGTSSLPATLARAEALLLRGEEGAVGLSRIDRTSVRALRLYQHAKALALMHHDVAAESRYLLAAELAAKVDRQKLAVHSLTRLSYFLHLRGHHTRALDMAEQALTHGTDPLAIYLKATLRRSLGKLRTFDDIVDAETNLRAVAKTLPSRALEKQRTAAQIELELWRRAATESATQEDTLGVFRACTALGDVAHVLICGLCWCLLESSPVPVLQNSLLTVMDADAELIEE